MNRPFIFIWLLSWPVVACGQWGISPELGIGSYNLEGIRFKSNTSTLALLPGSRSVDLKLLENFPPYINYGISVYNSLDQGSVARIGYNFYTSGARLYYEDYSGYAFKDYIVNAHAIKYTYAMPITRKVEQLHWYISPALLLGKYKYYVEYAVPDDFFYSYFEDQYTINLGATAGLEYEWHLAGISITAIAGYYVDLYAGTFQNESWFDFDNPYSTRKLYWRGIRGKMTVNIPFSLFFNNH